MASFGPCCLTHAVCLSHSQLRLQGLIDQVEGLIYFDVDSRELQQWDAQVHSLCSQLNNITDYAAAKAIEPSSAA